MLPTSALADWIRWESGFRASSGKAIISADGSPATDGVANLYHFHRVNFEAVLDWREGDILLTSPGEPGQWVYIVSEDADTPLQLTIRLSHVIGYEPIQLVDEAGPATLCSVLMGDWLENKSGAVRAPGSLSYQLQLFRAGNELMYSDDPDGVDYSDAGMTFHADLRNPVLAGSTRAPLATTKTSAKATPAPSTTTASHLSVANWRPQLG